MLLLCPPLMLFIFYSFDSVYLTYSTMKLFISPPLMTLISPPLKLFFCPSLMMCICPPMMLLSVLP